jgi:MGT family glycosyltransferase
MSRYLMALWAGGGNVPPQLVVAKRLRRRGHDVTVLAPHVLRQAVQASGAVFAPYRRAPEHDMATPELDPIRDWEVTGRARADRVRDGVMFGTAAGIAADLRELIANERPHVLVTDYMLLGGFVAGEAAGLPVAGLVHSVYPMPRPGVPAFGTGMSPGPALIGRLRDAALNRMVTRVFDQAVPELNRLRASLDLPPVDSMLRLFERARVVILTSAAFDFPGPLPDNATYAGVQVDPDALAEPPLEAGETPRVLVSLSTTYQRQADLLRRILTAAAAVPAHFLVTLGPALGAADFQPPANVELHSWLPHERVIPGASLVVTHGGHGTVSAALRHGVPVLCLPMGRDQGDVAARAVWRGAGLTGSAQAPADRLRKLIVRALADPRLGQRAGRLAAAMAADDPEAATRELEALASAAQSAQATGDVVGEIAR